METTNSYNGYNASSQSDQVLHEQDGLDGGGFVVDSQRALQFAIDTAKGMAYLHSLDRHMPRFHLNSKHVMVSSGLGKRRRAFADDQLQLTLKFLFEAQYSSLFI